MNKVYVANFGQGNSLWPQAKGNSTIATFDDVPIHEYWKAGDREGYIEASLANTLRLYPAKRNSQLDNCDHPLKNVCMYEGWIEK